MPKNAADDDFGCHKPLPLLCAVSELSRVTTDNLLTLSEAVESVSDQWDGSYFFTPELVREFNLIAMRGIYDCAGNYRDRPRITGDSVPPNHRLIPELVDEMCSYANACRGNPYHAAAYLLWRTYWIHPFYDGNKRVSRELCHLAILADTGDSWSTPLPELISESISEYMNGLEAADRAWARTAEPDVGQLETLLATLYIEHNL